MTAVIVPNQLRDAIMGKLDAEFAKFPDAEIDRDVLYQQLLTYYDEHGCIPEFQLVRRDP